MFSKLQYISQGSTVQEQLNNIRKALDHGSDWIQLRFKNTSQEDLTELSESVKLLCDTYLATFILNDHVHLARQIDADGVHLGLNDMKITEARLILGKSKIIGGTANTLQDVLFRVKEKCDYIGLGPFRFTTTKENLSPVLGLEGYLNTIRQLQMQTIEIPVYAIGGIQYNDIEPIMNTGIHGIAVSGLLTQNPQLIKQLNEKLYVNI